MTAKIFNPGKNQPWSLVKNLGWLVRHAREVSSITVTNYKDSFDSLGFDGDWDCMLRAHLTGGRYYITPFASRKVCWEWLKARRGLEGVMVHWFDEWRNL